MIQTTQKNLSIPTTDGYEFIPIQNIIYCKADNTYCQIHMTGQGNKLVTRLLREIEESLPQTDFLRVHHSYLININHLKPYHRSDGGFLILTEDHRIPISRNKKENVKNFLEDRFKS